MFNAALKKHMYRTLWKAVLVLSDYRGEIEQIQINTHTKADLLYKHQHDLCNVISLSQETQCNNKAN